MCWMFKNLFKSLADRMFERKVLNVEYLYKYLHLLPLSETGIVFIYYFFNIFYKITYNFLRD